MSTRTLTNRNMKVSNKIKASGPERAFDVFNVLFMILMCIVTLYPLLYVLFASFSDPKQLMAVEGQGLLLGPVGFSLSSYKAVLKNPNVWLGYRNTIIYVVIGTAFNIFMTVLAAYGLSRKNVFWNKYITMLIVFTMYFSGGLIPGYLNIRDLNLYDTYASLIIPGAISTYNMIIMRTAMGAVPDSLEESAKLDGATHLQILYKIMLPLTAPTIAVLVLYYGVGHWNAWFNASIYLKSSSKYPLQLFLRQVLIQNSTSEYTQGSGSGDQQMLAVSIKYAIIVVATLPILLLYPYLQKYFVKGVMVGSLKG